MTTRNLFKYSLVEAQLEQEQAVKSGLPTTVWIMLFVIPLVALLIMHEMVSLVLMSAGLWGPLLVIYWLMQIKEDEY